MSHPNRCGVTPIPVLRRWDVAEGAREGEVASPGPPSALGGAVARRRRASREGDGRGRRARGRAAGAVGKRSIREGVCNAMTRAEDRLARALAVGQETAMRLADVAARA